MKTNSGATKPAALAKYAALLAYLVLDLFGQAQGAAPQGNVIYAASMNNADVAAAVAQATNGDTVVVPPGTALWTNALLVSNGITLQFAGVGQSVIVNGQTNDFAPSWYESMITFFTTNTPDQNGNPRFYRLTGLEMVGNGWPNKNPLVKGAIQLVGNGSNVRVDNCMTSNLYDTAIETANAVTGVADHDVFYLPGYTFAFQFHNAEWPATGPGGTWSLWGDGSWQDSSRFGSSNFFFAENCSFINVSNVTVTAATDAFQGARWVVRDCILNNVYLSNHGTESGGFYRGPRACEVYNNQFTYTAGSMEPTVVVFRAATGVMFSNTVVAMNGALLNNFASLNEYRMTGNYPTWGLATGTNIIDQNIPTNTYFANGPWMIFTNTFSNTFTTLQAAFTGTPWTDNQWIGFSLVDISQPSGTTTANSTNFSIVTGNTSQGLTIESSQASVNTKINVGDVCQLWCISNALDMPGMGPCAAGLRDASGTITNNAAGLAQAIDPIYAWSNTINGVDTECTAIFPVMKQSIHYYNGVIKPGYTPFAYPHPLTLVASTLGAVAPLAPTNLRLAQ